MKEIYFKIGDKTHKAIAKVRINGAFIAIDFSIDHKIQILNFAVINNINFYATDALCTISVPVDCIIKIKNTDCDKESLEC